jgi:Myosin head (motor domain)
VPQDVGGAEYSRDALAKALYSRLFDWIVEKVNLALGFSQNSDALMIGVLDIYGTSTLCVRGVVCVRACACVLCACVLAFWLIFLL